MNFRQKLKKMLKPCLIIGLFVMFSACGAENTEEQTEYIRPNPTIPVVELVEEPDSEPAEIINLISPFVPNYVINIDVIPSEHIVTGAVQVSFQNTSEYMIDKVLFNIPFNVFSQDFDGIVSLPAFEGRIFQRGHFYGYMNVVAATVNLVPAVFSLDTTMLAVYLDEHLQPGQHTDIHIAFEAFVPPISHRTGANENAMWFGNFLPTLAVFDDGLWHLNTFFPVGHPFLTPSGNYDVSITTPPLFFVIAGTGGVRSQHAEFATTTFELLLARDFAFAVFSDVYSHSRLQTDSGADISVYHQQTGADIDIDAILATAEVAFDYFSARIGTLPYSAIDIAEVELFFNNTIAYPGMIFVDSRFFHSHSLHNAISRDMGLQWFYNVVGHNPISEAWLAHGLVAFLQLGLDMDNDEISAHAKTVHRNLAESFDDIEFTQLSRDLGHYNAWLEFHNVHGQRGMLLFYSLWRTMGDEAFDEFLRLYYQRYAFSIATSEGLIRAAEKIHGEPLDEFFDGWINSPALPALP